MSASAASLAKFKELSSKKYVEQLTWFLNGTPVDPIQSLFFFF